jgi:serine phosphatase RsbU (regulator of sigma subunit)
MNISDSQTNYSGIILDDESAIRERLYHLFKVEFGRVLQRELRKKEDTLNFILAEGITYKQFLELELAEVIARIGEFEAGESFFEKMYQENFKDDLFDSITAKNLLILYKYRIEAFRSSEDITLDENVIRSITKFVNKIIISSDDLNDFNLQEKYHSEKLISAVLKTGDIHFANKAIELIEKQSLVLMNLMNKIFIQKISEILKNEQLLKQELELKQKSINRELQKAKKIQENLLPKAYPSGVGLKFYAKYIPMESVGGDFYDIEVLPKENPNENDKIGVLIADVSGHGVPAAFIAAMAKISWVNAIQQFKTPFSILNRLNLQMLEISAGNFLTAFLGIFEVFHKETKLSDSVKGKFHYASAGHFSPYILRDKKDSLTLKQKGKILGVFQNIHLEEYAVDYYSGDRFIFFTDGILEAKNTERSMLGEEMLYSIFDKTRNLSGQEAIQFIMNELNSFIDCTKIDDDLTLLIIDVD